ncbi:MAG: hypothetical protein KDI33_08535 [Halioglobus sp.]|nr:hypothetical protein [Halioglobus sp.]
MNDTKATGSVISLENRFRQMRCEDTQLAPDFPSEAVFSQRDSSVAGHTAYHAIPKVAAAVAILAALVLLLLTREPVPEDPALLYTAIMTANPLTTESLLSVSSDTLPGMSSLPEMYETGPVTDERQRTN